MTKKRKRPKRRIVQIASDLHCNHRLGSLPPDVELLDFDELGNRCVFVPKQNAIQKYLWERLEADLDSVQQLASGAEIVTVINGDIHQGVKHKARLVSTLMNNHILIGAATVRHMIEPDNCKTTRILQGTDAHNFGGGASEQLTSQLLQDMPGKDVKCIAHLLADVDGVVFDLAHHGPHPGTRYWLSGNTARYYLRSAMLADLAQGQEPARVYVRSHYHRYIRETVYLEFNGKEYTGDIIITPSYCGLTSYGRQATRSVSVQTHGLVAFEIEDGKLVGIHPFKKKLDLRTKETL